MQISVNFLTPGQQMIWAVDADTGRDLVCKSDLPRIDTTASCNLYITQPNGTVYSQAGTLEHAGSNILGDEPRWIYWHTVFRFSDIPFTNTGLLLACITYTLNGKTITSLPFYLAVERSIS